MQGDDKRKIRTRRALAAALMELATRRPYESITIREITTQADVGYATFFRHYDSKDKLMLDIFQDIARHLEMMAGQHDEDFFEQEGMLIFSHVKDNAAFYRSVLDSLTFTRKLRKLFTQHIGQHVQRYMLQNPDAVVMPEIAANHMAVSLVGLIDWWLESRMRLPVAQMARLYDRLVVGATWHAILENNPLPLPWEV
ncbi:MAG TPA: TetR/AcrR family transcriptional regulator [Aggregatilineaceae bacterium]|nr:TetR/AcrR family transcriptional regulator [Aggregatilineaceae bacterium]